MQRGAIVIQWGPPHPGREVEAEQATERARSYFAGLEKSGKIGEYVEVASLGGSTRVFTGMTTLTGELPTLSAIQADPQFQQNLFGIEASHRDLNVELCVGGDEASLQTHENVRRKAWEEAGYL